MRKIVPLFALVAAACQPDVPQTPSTNDVMASSTNAVATNAVADPSVPPPVHLNPDARPLPADTTAAGAARAVLAYCDALATKRFADAYAMWADKGRASGHDLAEFKRFFDGASITDCVIGTPGEIQGAAGTLYVEVPNIFRAVRADGKRAEIDGPVILSRVNDVDGSTPEQRRWHIARAEFPLDQFFGR